MKQSLRNLIWCLSLLVIILPLVLSGCGPASGDSSTNEPQPTTTLNSEGNQAPVIDAIIPEWTAVERGKTTKIQIIAHDPDGDKLTISWTCTRGTLSGKGTLVTYTAPTGYMDDNPITVSVGDGRGGSEYSSINIPVVCCSHAQKNPDWKP